MTAAEARETAEPRLPLHPFYVGALFVTFVAIICVGDFHARGFAMAKLLTLLALILETVWARQALCFVAGVFAPEKNGTRLRIVTAALAVLAIGGAGELLYAIETGQNPPANSWYVVPGILAVLGFFLSHWLAAWALCEAEGKTSKLSYCGTFILFVYLFVCALLLYARLKRLAPAHV